ncbi:MAG: hypothetical protein H0W40_07745 [Methylibium sp.]|uniref:hypothetical protein n=1 Tax=Methylibium sp. TaxID=2067992 RepID=UPI0017D481BB|nr:hypothetical protein [Methylibium sp.]MBA3591619.1 hypothetical protein [Methylibium sp.]MBA3597254.1 hypothetical protein [Methylibium sp.]
MYRKPPAAKKAPAKHASLVRAKPAAKKAPAQARVGVTVRVSQVGGYKVFGSVMRPKHVTEQQIAEALVALE